MIPVVYVAGAYTADTPEQVEENVRLAIEAGVKIRNAGGVPFIPHLSHYIMPFVDEELRYNSDYWLEWDLVMLAKCDMLYLMPSWVNSKGAQREFEASIRMRNLTHTCFDMDYLIDRIQEVINASAKTET